MQITLPLLFVVGLAGCEKDLLAGLPDAAPDALAGKFKLYLNAEGVTLHPATACVPSGVDDSRTDCTTLLTVETTVPPFLPGRADRQTIIDGIVTLTRSALARYSIDIVTTRPSTGDYEMIVLGGDPAIFGQSAISCGIGSFNCIGTDNRNHVSLDFDHGSPGRCNYATLALDDLGTMVGLVATIVPDDCMCRFDAPCNTGTAPLCTFGVNVPTTMQLIDGSPANCGHATQDEPALLEAALGLR